MRRYTLDTRKYVAKTNDDLGFFSAKRMFQKAFVLRFLVAYQGEGM